jgi:glycogen debranching enzyme
VIKEKGQLTSSAPWYAWLNWEVFRITRDTAFLRQMYQSSKHFYNFYTTHRDTDHDGHEALHWKKDYLKRSALINKTFWDPVNHFYYNVNKRTHTFSYKSKDDLKRDEIIGFLPLWAGMADKHQARYRVRHLTDTATFWRRYGVPSLSAADPYYNPRGYWNGPVWIQWDYLIERGLLDYGYHKVAGELVHKVTDNMIGVLKSNHELWEFYDPDSTWGGYHRTYIWAGIVNRMMMDLKKNKPLKTYK